MNDVSEGIRLPLIVPGTRPELAKLEERISAERGRISLLYQVLLNSAPIASGWEQLLTAVRNQTSIPADLRELINLRVAVLNRAKFEFEAHVPVAKRAGLDGRKIEAVKEETVSQAYDSRETLMLELTDAMTRDAAVPERLFRRLKREFDDKGIVEFVATVAAYNMVSRFLVALNISH